MILSLWFSSVTNLCSLMFIIYQNRCICTGKYIFHSECNCMVLPNPNEMQMHQGLLCWILSTFSACFTVGISIMAPLKLNAPLPPSWCRACSSTRAVAHSTLASLGLNASCTTLTWPGWITCDDHVGSLFTVHNTPMMPRTCFPVNPQRAPSSACLCSPSLSL